MPLRLPPLCLRLGSNQIRQTLGLGQIHFTILKGAPGKFPGLGQAATRNPAQRLQQSGDYRRAAMRV